MKAKYKNLIKSNKQFVVNGMTYGSKRKTFKGCNGKCVFNPKTIEAFSYSHWRFVFKYKGVVLFNSYRYSNTTTRHQYAVMSLLNTLGINFVALNFGGKSLSPDSIDFAMSKYFYDLFIQELRINRCKDRTRVVQSINQIKEKIKLLKKLGASIDDNLINLLRKNAENDEKHRIERNRSKRKIKLVDNVDIKLLNNTEMFSL